MHSNFLEFHVPKDAPLKHPFLSTSFPLPLAPPPSFEREHQLLCFDFSMSPVQRTYMFAVTRATGHALILGPGLPEGKFSAREISSLVPLRTCRQRRGNGNKSITRPSPGTRKRPNPGCGRIDHPGKPSVAEFRFLDAMSPCFNSPRFSIVFQGSFHLFKRNRLSCLQA